MNVLRSSPRLPPCVFAGVRERTIFECCKWDPQCGDTAVLSDFALLLERAAWNELAAHAERLAAELDSAERALAARPELWMDLGLPRRLRKALALDLGAPLAPAPRVVRFDFHPTPDGWRISEANTDVPGGFIEASGFAALFAEHLPGAALPGNPAQAYAAALRACLPGPGPHTAALLHATAFTDDRQVMDFLAQYLEVQGVRALPLSPAHIAWDGAQPLVCTPAGECPADLLVRFFPAEWLANLGRARSLPGGLRADWRRFFGPCEVPASNPPRALLTQSKRFPLVWDRLHTPLPAWRELLPETRDPRACDWRRDERWILKPALGRVGEGIGMRGVTPEKTWRQIARHARWFPGAWAAQRAFEAVPVYGPDGTPVHSCVGVFTVDGRACGAYGRIAPRALIDGRAADIAVLISDAPPAPPRAAASAQALLPARHTP